MCVKGSTATELKSVSSAAQKYLDVQIPVIRCLSTFVFWAEVMSSREGIKQRKVLFFPLKGIKAVFIRKNQNIFLGLLNHADFSGNGLSPLPYLSTCFLSDQAFQPGCISLSVSQTVGNGIMLPYGQSYAA